MDWKQVTPVCVALTCTFNVVVGLGISRHGHSTVVVESCRLNLCLLRTCTSRIQSMPNIVSLVWDALVASRSYQSCLGPTEGVDSQWPSVSWWTCGPVVSACRVFAVHALGYVAINLFKMKVATRNCHSSHFRLEGTYNTYFETTNQLYWPPPSAGDMSDSLLGVLKKLSALTNLFSWQQAKREWQDMTVEHAMYCEELSIWGDGDLNVLSKYILLVILQGVPCYVLLRTQLHPNHCLYRTESASPTRF